MKIENILTLLIREDFITDVKKLLIRLEKIAIHSPDFNKDFIQMLEVLKKSKNWNECYCINLAEAYARNREYSKAIGVFVNEISESFNINLRLCDLYTILNNYNSAEKYLNKCTPKNEEETVKYLRRKNLLESRRSDYSNINIRTIVQDMLTPVDSTFYNKNSFFENFCFKFKSAFMNENVYVNVELNNEIDANFKNVTIKPYLIDKLADDSCIYGCSFNMLNAKSLSLVFPYEGREVPCVTFEISSINKVLRGLDNWLFLDNDTNMSVSQFKGDILIDDEQMNKWVDFLSSLSKYKNIMFLIPPSKESIYKEYYPFKQSNLTPLTQLIKLLDGSNVKYLYPFDILKKDVNSYCKTDTHWSYYGAMSVLSKILPIIDSKSIDFSYFKFIDQQWYGDLGSKIIPLESSLYKSLQKSFIDACESKLVFFNGIKTQGRIKIYQNNEYIIDKSIIIFGDSFSTQLLPFITHIFKRVVLIRSNANIIKDVIDCENPDFIIPELTERFIIKSPSFYNTLSDFTPCVKTDNPNVVSYLNQYKNNVGMDCYLSYISNYISIIESC